MSKVVVPIGNQLVVSYMTSVLSNIVFLTAFEIFLVMMPIDSQWEFDFH